MCNLCTELVELIKQSNDIRGAYVVTTFPNGTPELVIPLEDGKSN